MMFTLLRTVRRLMVALLAFTASHALSADPVKPVDRKPEIKSAPLAATRNAPNANPFDGKSLVGWSTQDGKPIATGWEVVDGEIHLKKDGTKAGNIVTTHDFADFDLSFEWRIAPKGNSGIKYRVRSYDGKILGCEYQIYDDRGAKTPKSSKNGSGALYDLYEPNGDKQLMPIDEYNTGRIVVKGNHVEHWLNGKKIVDAEIGDAEWKKRVQASKFNDVEGFALEPKGRLMLTDHGSEVWYRNIKFAGTPYESKPFAAAKPKPPAPKKPAKPATKPGTKPETKPTSKPAVPPTSKPAPESSPKPATKPAAKPALPTPSKALKETFTYKKAGDLEIKADVEIAGGPAPRPVVVWIHGGALINGHRESVPGWLREAFLPRGYAVVSIDYRLAPETKLAEIAEDVEDAFTWLRLAGPEMFGADPKRIAVVGGSAGGYLTLLCGLRVDPAPKALVSLWGYGDLGAPWTFEASKHDRHNAAKFAEDELSKVLAGSPIADSRDRAADGAGYYQHVRRTGTWAEAISGWDPKSRPAKFLPFMPERNVAPEYPPTLLIHGDADTDVPYDSSARMAEELTKHKVPHRLIRFKGAEHGLPGVDPKQVAAAYQEAVEFIDSRMQQKK